MHFSHIVLPLAAAGLSAASPILEQRADAYCSSNARISSIVNELFKPSAVPFCNSLLNVPVQTVTEKFTRTAKTVTNLATITGNAQATATVTVTFNANGGAAVTAAPQDAGGEVVPKNPNATGAKVTARALDERQATKTPKRLATLGPKVLSSVCSCITQATVTTSVTDVIGTRITKFETTTISGSAGATVTATVTAAPSSFYLKIKVNSGTSADGKFAVVNGEYVGFSDDKSKATKFSIDSENHLVSGSNGWVANMSKDSPSSTLFFDSPALIDSLGLIEVKCNRSNGPLTCTSQSNANTFYYCESVGSGMIFAGANHNGTGCKKITLAAVAA